MANDDLCFLNITELAPLLQARKVSPVEVVEALRCLAEGVVASAADADSGSVLGIGFPAHTGGVVSFARAYPGGIDGFTARAHELADRYGDRFLPPEPGPQFNEQPEWP